MVIYKAFENAPVGSSSIITLTADIGYTSLSNQSITHQHSTSITTPLADISVFMLYLNNR